MQGLRDVGVDAVLTTEQGLYVKQVAVEAARRAFVGRKLFSTIRPIDPGAQTYGYDVKTNVSDASLDFTWPGRQSQDILNFTRSTVGIPTLHKETVINKLDLAASRMTGTPLNTSTIESCAYKVAYLEDKMLIDGYAADGTTYEINGLLNAAGNSFDGSDWGTATNIPTDINGAINTLMTDNILPPYDLTLNSLQYVQTLTFIANTAVSYLQWIKEIIGGSVYMSPVLTDNFGIMTQANNTSSFEYVVAEDLSTETEITDLKDGANLFARVYVRGLPVVYDSNAICKLYDIGT